MVSKCHCEPETLTYISCWECFGEIRWQPREQYEKHPTAAELANKHSPKAQHPNATQYVQAANSTVD